MGVASTSIAKINPPKLAKIVSRQRLFNTLDDGLGKPVMWIKGNAGAGKTTIIASYLETKNNPLIWYQIDAGDSDPASFMYYLSLAAKKELKSKTTALPVFKPDYLPSIKIFSQNYFRTLFQHLNKPCTLVLDNLHECTDNTVLYELLATGFEEIPEQITVIVISRDGPSAEFAKLKASDKLFLFNPNDLLLTLDECRQVFHAKVENKPEQEVDEYIAIAYQMTQGWAAGLVLMLDQIQDKTLSENSSLNDNQVIFDYFASQVFSAAEPDLQEFLLKTSLLPIMTPELAQHTCRVTHANKIFNRLIRDNFFIIKHATVKSAYQYHPLFKEFLNQRAHETLGKYEIIELVRDSAVLLAESGQIEDAVKLFLEVEDWHSIAKIVSTHGAKLVSSGRHSTLKDWIDSIPDNVITITPQLQYWAGVCLQPLNLQRSRKYFTQAYDQFKKSGDFPGLYLAWCGIVETYITEWGNFKPLDFWISAMEKILQEQKTFPSADIEARVAASMFSALMYRQPDHPEIDYWRQKLHDTILLMRDSKFQIKMGYQLYLYYIIWVGDLANAGMLAKLLRPGKKTLLDPATYTLWYALDSLYHWKIGEHQKSLEMAEKGLALANASDFHIWDSLLYSAGTYALLSLNQQQQAQNYIAAFAESLNPKRLWDVVNYHYLLGRLNLFTGNTHEALVHCETGLRSATASGSPYAEALIRTIYAQVLFHSKQKEKAVAVNNLLRQKAEKMHAQNMLFIALMSEAEFAFDSKSTQRAIKALRQAFTIARDQNLIKHAFWWPPVMAKMCIKALEHDIETGFVHKVIRVRRLTPTEPPFHIANWPWAIRVCTLGTFSLYVDDKLISLSGKANKRPIELLKVVLALGGDQIDQYKIIEVLWPDAEGDSAKQSFHTTLHRLRKLLGDEALTLHSGYLSVNHRLVWIDFMAYERIVTIIDRTLKLVASKENMELISSLSDQIADIYQNDFLSNDAEQSWFLPRQQKLKTSFIQLMLNLGAYWQKQSQPDQAISCYHRGLEIDNLSETLYQHSMKAYHDADRNADALAVFQRCRKTLSDHLGTSPSSKTIEIYKLINSGNPV